MPELTQSRLWLWAVIILGPIFLVEIIYRVCNINRIRSIQEGTDTVVITGVSSGMGLVTALYLCDKIGFQVFGTVRKPEDGEKVMNMVKNKQRMKILIMDVTKQDTIDKAVEEVSQVVGDNGLYGLFNNAGTSRDYYPCELSDIEEFKWLFDVNTLGALRVTNGFLPLLRKCKGTIVNNTSIAGFSAFPFTQPYSCTKFALESISDSQRKELQLSGVRLVVLECGFIKSSILTKQSWDEKKVKSLLPDLRKHYPGFLKNFNKEEQEKGAERLPKLAASAEIVAHTIDKSFRGSNPKNRYVIGGLSGFVNFMRHFSEKTQDTLSKAQVKGDPDIEIEINPANPMSKTFAEDPFFEKYGYQQSTSDEVKSKKNQPEEEKPLTLNPGM